MIIIKRKNAITIDFSNGEAAEHVTGSCIYIESNERKIVLECGLAQSNNLKKDYFINKEKFNFKVKELDYIFLFHAHADHTMRVPLLYKRGFRGTIYVPKGNRSILKDMYQDSLKIMGKDATALSIQLGKTVEPLYSQEDVDGIMNSMVELDFDQVHVIDEYIKIKYTSSGHIIHAAQGEIWITSGNTTKKIIYTSDLGNPLIEKNYVEPFKPLEKANLVIGECTYGDDKRAAATLSTRARDLIKMREIVYNTCIERRRKVLIPVFALDRAQTMLTLLYEMFGKDEHFDIPIILDTPLGLKHFKNYFNTMKEEDVLKLQEVMSWRNLIQVRDWPETNYWANTNKGPCIILASSGMMQNGRILSYLPNILSHWENHILFCGFLSENSLGWKIKNGKSDKYIKVNGQPILNQCAITSLNSFSSHMQFNELVQYYTNLNCEKLALVHGDMRSKVNIKDVIQEEYSKKGKTTKVVAVNKATVLHI